jgi:hypothetical protein
MQSYYRKILNQQPPTDIVIGGDLACIEDLYSLLPPHSPSSNCPATIILAFCVLYFVIDALFTSRICQCIATES